MANALPFGIVASALTRYHQVTGNERAFKMLQTVADDSIEKLGFVTPEGFFLKTSSTFRDYYAPEPDFFFEALAYLTLKTGRPNYAKLGYQNLQRLFIERNMLSNNQGIPGAHFYRYWLPALALYDELGILTDPKPW